MLGWGRKHKQTQWRDDVLLHIAPGIPFTTKMATEGVFCCAELGWGKTWLVFLRFLRAYVQAMGGWLLAAKAEDLAKIRRVFAELKAEDRLTVISPQYGNRVNAFDALAQIAPPGSETEEIVGALSSLMEIEGRTATRSSGENSQFFKPMSSMLLSAIVGVLRLAGERLGADSIHRFLISLPVAGEQLRSEEWQASSYANQCMAKAYPRVKTAQQRADYDHAMRFLFGEFMELNSRTRSSIVSSVSAMISRFCRGWMYQIWSTTTNIRLESAFDGQWFLFDTSPLAFGEYGTSSLVLAKHIVQRMVMRRRVDESSAPVGLMFDECQNVLVPGGDRDYQAIVREKKGCTWAASQNLSGLSAVLGGDQAAEAQIKSWLALFGCKIFGTNSCWATNSYASELCGQRREWLMSSNFQQRSDATVFDMLMGRGGDVSSGGSEQYQPIVRPERFVRLRKPEPPAYEADAIVLMPRLQQVTGRHWAEVTFRPVA